MQWHEVIFSQKKEKRLLRHTVFWITWWLYFSFCDYLYKQPSPFGNARPLFVNLGSYQVLKTFLLIWIYALGCYVFLYIVLPKIINGNWLKATTHCLLTGIFLCTSAYVMYWYIFPLVDSVFGTYKENKFPTRFWPAVYLGLINPSKVLVAAAIIKYVKYWWLKQKESERLEREMIAAELQLLKAQIHPGFLFTALHNIHAYSSNTSPLASELLLKLSDLLSYMLYECDQPFVPLKKEITMMKDYIAMEKIRLGDSFEMELTVMGDADDKIIAPFLLLPFIENSFKQTGCMTGYSWVNMDIVVDGDAFHMKLANGLGPGTNGLQEVSANGLGDVQKRLTLLYPQKHELKISAEQEMLIVHLKIQLSDIVSRPNGNYELAVDEVA